MAKRLEIYIEDNRIKFNNEGFSEIELLGLADMLKLHIYDRIRLVVNPANSVETKEGEKGNV